MTVVRPLQLATCLPMSSVPQPACYPRSMCVCSLPATLTPCMCIYELGPWLVDFHINYMRSLCRTVIIMSPIPCLLTDIPSVKTGHSRPMGHRVRWLGHADRKPNDVMVKQLLFAHSTPGPP